MDTVAAAGPALPLDPVLAFEAAFAKLQAELPVIVEAGEVPAEGRRAGYRYALWEDISEAIRPHLSAHGFNLRFRVTQEAASITVTATLVHLTGHREETTLSLPIDLSGGKNAVQAVGSTVSYGKRYAASLLLNITTRGEDDDGRAGGRGTLVSTEEIETLKTLLKLCGRSEARLLAYLKLERLEDLPRSRFASACDLLRVRGGAQ